MTLTFQKHIRIILFTFVIGCDSERQNIDNPKKKFMDKNRFVSEHSFKDNLENQLQRTPQTLSHLRAANVTSENELKLEFFFYTNSENKAGQLANELATLNYSVDHRLAADSKTEYLITGWTNKIIMTDDQLGKWTRDMCELGYKYDCEFDGWGTQLE
jgi:hypothetical protein